MYKALCLAFSILLAAVSVCLADTFIHRQSGEILHGYATQQSIDNKSLVHTIEKGQQYLDLVAYDVQADRLGRENRVIAISLEESILLEIETQAIEKAVVSASDQGPLFILLEIDTPGGRVDLVKQICAAIMKTDNCRVIAFVPGGKYGGAFSGGAAIALACDKIYMAGGTAIGAVALTAQTSTGQKDIDEIYGETVREKFTSAWRGYLAALAEKNSRPGLLAMAMVDKDIEVVEVDLNGKQLFVEPANKKPTQKVVRTWSGRDSLVTLTAADAVRCNIADKVVNSRKQLLLELGAGSAKLVYETAVQRARKRFEKAKARFQKLMNNLDYHRKQLKEVKITTKRLAILRSIISDYKNLIRVAKNFPDVPVSVQTFEKELNSAQAAYDGARMRR